MLSLLGACSLSLACSHGGSAKTPSSAANSSMTSSPESSVGSSTGDVTSGGDQQAGATKTTPTPSSSTAAQGASPTSASAEAKPTVDPGALSELARSTAFLHGLESFKVHAETTRDKVVGDRYKLQKNETIELVVQHPDRMRAEIVGDDRDQLVVDDGKTLTIYSRPEKYYATMSALPTVHETLDVATARYGIEAPLVDLMQMAANRDLSKDVVAARVIGPSTIDGVVCDHLAFRTKDLDWQMWIERGQKPLPRKIVVTTRGDATAPQYTARMIWDTTPAVVSSQFAFTPPEGATQMALASVVGAKKGTAGGDDKTRTTSSEKAKKGKSKNKNASPSK
jgi:hypothetical protein